MATFADFVQTELPLRPFVSTDGAAGQTLVRSTNPLAVRELVWADAAAGAKGDTGAAGQSAYQIAVALGFVGTEAAWLASLKGDAGTNGTAGKDGTNGIDGKNGSDGASAFALAQTLGFTGTLSEWLASLKGAKGDTGTAGVDGKDGVDGIGIKGDTGLTGQSAYELAVTLGFVGDQTAWIASLRGATGTVDTTLLTAETNRAATVENDLASRITAETTSRISADQSIQNAIDALTADVADLKTNEAGEIIGVSQAALDAAIAAEATLRTNADNDLASLIAAIPAGPKGNTGDTGASAYQIAVAIGYQGTEGDWLSTLVGPKGEKGDTGLKGDTGDQGLSIKGDKGDQGLKGDTGLTGLSAYQIATFNGFQGTEIEWLISLKGATGAKGADGTGVSIVYQTPLVGIDAHTTGVVDSLDFTQYSQGVWDVVLQTFNKIRRFTVASLYNSATNKLSYTTYGIIGDAIKYVVTIGYDTLTSTLKLYIQNNGEDTFIVSALRYPVKNS